MSDSWPSAPAQKNIRAGGIDIRKGLDMDKRVKIWEPQLYQSSNHDDSHNSNGLAGGCLREIINYPATDEWRALQPSRRLRGYIDIASEHAVTQGG
jgi:hypothetical protein